MSIVTFKALSPGESFVRVDGEERGNKSGLEQMKSDGHYLSLRCQSIVSLLYLVIRIEMQISIISNPHQLTDVGAKDLYYIQLQAS